jgi:hypothetical protein
MFFGKRGLSLVFGLLVAFSAGQAGATMVDFEDVAVASGSFTNESDVTSNGFTFNTATNHSHLANNFTGVDNGGTYLGIDDAAGPNPTIMFEGLNGDSFNLRTVDLAEWNTSASATSVELTGFYAAGGTVSETVVFDQVYGAFQTEVLNWAGLSQVQFEGFGPSGNYYAIDNLDLSVVPEPASMTLLGLGLAGVAVRRRRKRV